MQKLAPSLVNLIYQAALKSYWRKTSLRLFLRQMRIAETFLNSWAPEESKRQFLDRLFSKVVDQPRGPELLLAMARDLGQQTSFPDLEGWEDSKTKLADARAAVADLQKALAAVNQQVASAGEQAAARKRAADIRAETARVRQTLDTLNSRLTALVPQLGTQQAGYGFQDWFYDLADFFEVDNRRPYVVNGRQIDGSLTVGGTTYLVELKFTRDQSGAPDIDTLLRKVNSKADNTMGVMVSMSGYSDTAVSEASGPRTPLLLMDHRHIYLLLSGATGLGEVVERIRRHASQTGEAFLPPDRFGG